MAHFTSFKSQNGDVDGRREMGKRDLEEGNAPSKSQNGGIEGWWDAGKRDLEEGNAPS